MKRLIKTQGLLVRQPRLFYDIYRLEEQRVLIGFDSSYIPKTSVTNTMEDAYIEKYRVMVTKSVTGNNQERFLNLVLLTEKTAMRNFTTEYLR